MKLPHAQAAELAQIIESVVPFLRAMAVQSYGIANSEGQQQAIMDALPDFGVPAAQAINVYATIYGALELLGQAEGLTPPDLEVFQAQEDGSVIVVIPPVEPPIVD